MKNKIFKGVIGGMIIIGFIGGSLSLVDNKERISDIMNQEVTIMNQLEYNMFLQRKITPVKEMTYDILGMRKIFTDINYLSYQNKIDTTVETIDGAIIDMSEQNLTSNQKSANTRTIEELGTLKVHLNSLKQRLGEANEFTGVFDFHNDRELEAIYSDILASIANIDDYIGLGEEIRP